MRPSCKSAPPRRPQEVAEDTRDGRCRDVLQLRELPAELTSGRIDADDREARSVWRPPRKAGEVDDVAGRRDRRPGFRGRRDAWRERGTRRSCSCGVLRAAAARERKHDDGQCDKCGPVGHVLLPFAACSRAAGACAALQRNPTRRLLQRPNCPTHRWKARRARQAFLSATGSCAVTEEGEERPGRDGAGCPTAAPPTAAPIPRTARCRCLPHRPSPRARRRLRARRRTARRPSRQSRRWR